MELNYRIGNNIKTIRESMELGLNKTAQKVGISGGYLSTLERGEKKNPSMDILNAIAIALNVNINEFFKSDVSSLQLSSNINIDEGISNYNNLLKMDISNDSRILYTNTVEWLKELKELKELREFKNKVVLVVNLYSQKFCTLKKPVDPHKTKGLPVYF